NAEFLFKKTLYADPEMASERQTALMASIQADCDAEKKEVVTAGGLHIIGTERHESRRIDNQLRGRSGRQGDPGSSRFYLSLEDDLLRIFGSERIQRIMERLGMEEGEPIEHKLVTRAITTAQKRVETRNFEIRKHLLEYDDVMNKQREIVYGLRRETLEGESQEEQILEWASEVASAMVGPFAPQDAHVEDWDLAGLNEALYRQFDVRLAADEAEAAVESGSAEALEAKVQEAVEGVYRERERQVGPELFHRLERWIILGLRWEDGEFRGIDQLWKDHLLNMDHLKEGIGLRGYGQRDPLTEYKKEAFDLFQDMVDRVKGAVVERVFKVQVVRDAPMELPTITAWANAQEGRGAMPGDDRAPAGPPAAAPRPVPRTPTGQKIGRNDPCYCGSGKKYKKCHLLQEG